MPWSPSDNIRELCLGACLETGLLLEVVNYNVEQQQYVCAGNVSISAALPNQPFGLIEDPASRPLDPRSSMRSTIPPSKPRDSKLRRLT